MATGLIFSSAKELDAKRNEQNNKEPAGDEMSVRGLGRFRPFVRPRDALLALVFIIIGLSLIVYALSGKIVLPLLGSAVIAIIMMAIEYRRSVR
jgi:hypothetical protein